MLLVAGEIFLTAAAALALCCYAGWGAVRLALPASLRSLAAPITPLAGYAISVWVGYLGVSSVLSLRWALGALLLLATALNLAAWRRDGPPRPLAALRAHAALLLIVALALLAGVLPLLQYGYVTAIGRGWDTESYLPMAQHLVDYPVARIGEAPVSPLRDLVRDPPRIGLSLGFSVLQGFTMLLTGQGALATFAPLLALLRALGVLAAYVWLRAAMGLGRAAALLAAALTALGALMLWVTFFNFGMQLSSWPLVGLGLALGLATVDDLALRGQAAWRAALLCGVALAALPVAYYPALTIFAPMAAGLGLARLIETATAGERRWRSAGRLLLASGALAGVTLLLAAPAVADYFKGFSFRYSLVAGKIGPDHFIPASDILGLTAFRLEGGGAQPPALLVWAAGAVTALLVGAGLAVANATATQRGAPRHRLRWLLVLGPLLGYMAWLRFGRPYEYAYMKSGAYLGMAGWGAAMLGWQVLRERSAARLRVPLSLAALLPLLAAGWAQSLVLAEHGRGPALFGRDLTALAEPAAQIPPGAAVLISSDERLVGPNAGLLSALVYGRQVWGRVATAYGALSYWPAGATPQYAILAAGERPWPLSLGGSELWRSRAVALYRLDPETALLRGRAGLSSGEPLADSASPATLALWRQAGPLRRAAPGAPLMLLVGDALAFGPGEPTGSPGLRRLRITVAALASQEVRLSYAGATTALQIPPGVSAIDLALAAPERLVLEPADELALVDATMRHADAEAQPAVAPLPGGVAWGAAVEQRGDHLELTLTIANPERHALRAELTLIEDTFDAPHRSARLLAALPPQGEWRLRLDPLGGASEALVDGSPTPLLEADVRPAPPDGAYFGVLALYSGEEAVAREPLFTVRVEGGQLAELTPAPIGIEATAALPPEPLTANLRALYRGEPLPLDGGQAVLEQAVLAREPAYPGAPADAPLAPGARLTAQLYWRALSPLDPLMVSLQVVDAEDRKRAQWDGPLGAWHPSQSWAPGERVRQDVPLALDAATPPGRYRLLLVAYDPASGAPRPIAGQQALLLGELEVR